MALPRCGLVPASVVKETLGIPPASLDSGKIQPEPFSGSTKKSAVPVIFLVDNNIPQGTTKVEVHRHEADIFMCIDGEVEFQVEGSLVAPWIWTSPEGKKNDLELRASEIQGGVTYHLTAGDILHIPAGQPHIHWTKPGGFARMWVIKIPTPTLVPFEDIPGWGV